MLYVVARVETTRGIGERMGVRSGVVEGGRGAGA